MEGGVEVWCLECMATTRHPLRCWELVRSIFWVRLVHSHLLDGSEGQRAPSAQSFCEQLDSAPVFALVGKTIHADLTRSNSVTTSATASFVPDFLTLSSRCLMNRGGSSIIKRTSSNRELDALWPHRRSLEPITGIPAQPGIRG